MPPPLQRFRGHEIAEDSLGNSLELWRTEHEVVCLASAPAMRRFVELHVLTGADTAQPASDPVKAAFRSSIQALQAINDPHIIEVREAGEDEGALYYVTEFIDGEPLDSYLARCNPVPTWLAVELARQLTAGLIALRSDAALLSRVEVFNARLTLEGESTDDAVVKLSDFGLGRVPAESPSLHDAGQRAIRQVGRLLVYALGGLLAEKIDTRSLANLPIPVTLAELLARLLDPAGRQPVRDLPTLQGILDSCRQDVTPVAMPARLPQSLRPRLPLQEQFPKLAQLTAALDPGYRLERTPFDAAHPYSQRAFAGSRSVNVHLLPPPRLMADDYLPQIRLAADRAAVEREGSPLLRVLEIAPGPEAAWFIEDGPPRLSLDAARRLRRGLTASEAAVFMREINRAVLAIEKLGLTPVAVCPQQMFVEFARGGADEGGPGDDALASDPVDRWPAFSIRLRAHPIPLQLIQPHRFRRERLLAGGPRTRHDAGPAGGGAPTAADFAALFAWLCGGISRVPAGLAPLLTRTLAGGGEPNRTKFLEHILPLARKPSKSERIGTKAATKSAPMAPLRKAGRKPTPRPGATPSALKSLASRNRLGPVSVAVAPPAAMQGQAPVSPASAKNRSAAAAMPAAEALPTVDFFCATQGDAEEGSGDEAGGFAEVLLAMGETERPLVDSDASFPASASPHSIAGDDDELADGDAPVGALFGSWQGDSGTGGDGDEDPSRSPPVLPEAPDTGVGLLLLLIVLAALAIAAIMAHVTGLAPWK